MAECPEKRTNGLFEMCGVRFPLSSLITAESVQKYLYLHPKPNDVFISSYPKCDSNIVDLIVFSLLFPEQKMQEPNKVTNRHLQCMEMTTSDGYMNHMLQQASKHKLPRLFKTYLPFRLIPMYRKAKYIYVVRTPWDLCASYYRFLHQLRCIGDSFEDFSEEFLAGNVAYGSMFEHIAPWAKLSATDNVLVLSYEHAQHNPQSTMFKIAAFLGDKYLRALTDIADFESNLLGALMCDKPKQKCSVDGLDPPLVEAIAAAILLKEEKPESKVIEKPVLTFAQIKVIAEKASDESPGSSIEQLWLNLLKKTIAMLPRESVM